MFTRDCNTLVAFLSIFLFRFPLFYLPLYYISSKLEKNIVYKLYSMKTYFKLQTNVQLLPKAIYLTEDNYLQDTGLIKKNIAQEFLLHSAGSKLECQ
jgi:hypothetical protein